MGPPFQKRWHISLSLLENPHHGSLTWGQPGQPDLHLRPAQGRSRLMRPESRYWTTMKMMAMMNTKVLVTIDNSSSIAPKTDKLSIISDNGNYVRLRWWKLLSKTRFIMRNHVLGFQLFYRNPELDPLHRLITIFLHCYHCQDPHSSARAAVDCSQEEPQRNAGATNIIYKVL